MIFYVCWVFCCLTAQLTRPETWRQKNTQWPQTHRGLLGPKHEWTWRGPPLLTRTSSCCWVLCKSNQVMLCRTTHRTSDAQGESSMCSKGRLPFSVQVPKTGGKESSYHILPEPGVGHQHHPSKLVPGSGLNRDSHESRRHLSDEGAGQCECHPRASVDP